MTPFLCDVFLWAERTQLGFTWMGTCGASHLAWEEKWTGLASGMSGSWDVGSAGCLELGTWPQGCLEPGM